MKDRNGLVWRVFGQVLGLGLLLGGLTVGCDRGSTVDSVVAESKAVATESGSSGGEEGQAAAKVGQGIEKEEVAREHYYSPFLITTESDVVFKTITFTDVGISQPDPGRVDDTLLETIAESLAYHLSQSESLNYTPKVHYDAAMVDPNNHLFCEQHHLYVAVWKGYSPDRWGYSLWSGCNEEHQFAWKEVLVPAEAEGDLLATVKPLTVSIVESLALATEKECYLSEC